MGRGERYFGRLFCRGEWIVVLEAVDLVNKKCSSRQAAEQEREREQLS